jgi:predicted metal-binding membrane protein
MTLFGVDERPGRPVALALAWVALLACTCWAWFAFQGVHLPPGSSPRDLAGPMPAPLEAGELVLVFAMWTGLCVGLMLPVASSAAFIYLRVARGSGAVRWPRLTAGLFALGCLLAWCGFAALLTILHWTLHDAGMLDPSLAVRHPAAMALALVAAGAWQWTPAKHDCLQYCRTPLPGVLAEWRSGPMGALWQGAEHGRICLGGCWLLLLLPLAGGPGNPGLVAAVGLLLLAELRLDEGPLVGCAAGLVMVAWGTLLLFP